MQTFLDLSRVPPHEPDRGQERVTSLRTSAWEVSGALAYRSCTLLSSNLYSLGADHLTLEGGRG